MNDINGLNFESCFITSFDVESLFTNIPLTETIDIVTSRLYANDCPHRPAFSETDFKNLLTIACTDSCFEFNGKLYVQVDGVAMGSPLGPVLANVFLCHLEEQYMKNCSSFPLFYRRYVDDTFAIFHDRNEAMKFFDFINELHPNITFTMEEEQNNCISFLDTEIRKKINGCFDICTHHKSTQTNLLMNFDSYVPFMYKIGLIKCLFYRAYKICSSWISIHVEFEFIKKNLKLNGFPTHIIENVCSKFLDSVVRPDIIKPVIVPKCDMFIKLPYYGHESLIVKKKLIKLIESAFPCVNLRVIYASGISISNLFPFKGPCPKLIKSGVVYKISCDACGASYIGKTTACLYKRLDRELGGKENSAAYQHTQTFGPLHFFDKNLVEILSAGENNNVKLEFKESLNIKFDQSPLNRNVASRPLKLF